MFQDGQRPTCHQVQLRVGCPCPQENQIDFVKGVATALLTVTFFEVTTNKAFRALVDVRNEVSIETGMRAAEKLPAVLEGHA